MQVLDEDTPPRVLVAEIARLQSRVAALESAVSRASSDANELAAARSSASYVHNQALLLANQRLSARNARLERQLAALSSSRDDVLLELAALRGALHGSLILPPSPSSSSSQPSPSSYHPSQHSQPQHRIPGSFALEAERAELAHKVRALEGDNAALVQALTSQSIPPAHLTPIPTPTTPTTSTIPTTPTPPKMKAIPLHEGAFFGEVALYTPSSRRMADVVARSDADIMILSRSVIDDVLSNYPSFKATFEEHAKERSRSARGGTSGTSELVGEDWMHALGMACIGYDPHVLVAIRLAPPEKVPASGDSHETVLNRADNNAVSVRSPGWSAQEAKVKARYFKYDYVFDPAATTAVIEDQLGIHVVNAVFDGYHTCVLGYGQTGTGKTFTLRGLISLMSARLFDRIASESAKNPDIAYSVQFSGLEIYCEHLRDLLFRSSSADPPELKLRGSAKTNVYVENLSRKKVSSLDELEFFFHAGMEARTMAKTATNQASSPAHTIFTIYLTRTHTSPDGEVLTLMNKLTFADLAGTQREYIKRTGLDAVRHENDGSEASNERERRKINLALQTLGVVIHNLAINHDPPYRQSKLSMLLAQSLGGNSKTFFIATVLPTNLKLSLRTLKDAEFAMMIQNKAVRSVFGAGSGAFLSGKRGNLEYPPLTMGEAWDLIIASNAAMTDLGEPLSFSLIPNDDVSLRYTYAVAAHNNHATLSALYDPDEFEMRFRTLELAQDRDALQIYGHPGARWRHPGFPFYIPPPKQLIASLYIDASGLVAASSRTTKVVAATFSTPSSSSSTTESLSLSVVAYLDPVSLRPAAPKKMARTLAPSTPIPASDFASTGPLSPSAAELADAVRNDASGLDVTPGTHATLRIHFPAFESVPSSLPSSSLQVYASLPDSPGVHSQSSLPSPWAPGDAFDGTVSLPVVLSPAWFDDSHVHPLTLAIYGSLPLDSYTTSGNLSLISSLQARIAHLSSAAESRSAAATKSYDHVLGMYQVLDNIGRQASDLSDSSPPDSSPPE